MGTPTQPKPDISFHDRLDLLLHTDDYVDQPCGTVSASDGKKKYCSNECPTLKKDLTGGA